MNRKLKRLIDNSELVSFDIFDTLIFRNCRKPEDVFFIVGSQLQISGSKFCENRKQAELEARKKKREGEITLNDIYEFISLDKSINKEECKKLEELVEMNICLPNKEMKEIFDYCCQNKEVILTSDMYLEQEIIETILSKCGYKGYKKLFLSSKINKKKSTGHLFEYILNEYSIAPNKILHIGDNQKSDFINPIKKGIKAYLYNNKNKDFCVFKQDCIILDAFIKNSFSCKITSFYYEFGYKILGPAVYGYCNWINSQLQEKDIKKIFFFAREGQFIKKAFDCISDKKYDEQYLYVSRRSLTVPAISSAKTIDDFLAYRPVYDRVKVKDQIIKLGLEIEDFKDSYWFSEKILNKSFGELTIKQKDKILNSMFEKVKIYSQQELDALLGYLKENNVNGKFAIIDLGWNGSMQRALSQVLFDNNIKFEMVGFFLAQRDEYYKNKKYIENYGYLFNYGEVKEDENLLLNSGTNLLELLFCADHGTTIKYYIDNNSYQPLLDHFEYEDVFPIINECQKGAIDFIEDYQKYFPKEIVIDFKSYFEPMYNILKQPSYDLIENFGDLIYSDMNEKDLYLAKKVNIFSFKQFINEFKAAGWKVAFLKRNLKTNQAFKIYCSLRKVFN